MPHNDDARGKMLERIAKLPRINLHDRRLYDLEMLLNGGFAPLTGFMDRETYESVVEDMRLPNGELWPMPIVFDVPSDSIYSKGDELVLCDRFGYPLAIMTVTSVFTPDKKREAEKVYGTKDTDHFGVKYIQSMMGDVYLGGPVERISNLRTNDFKELRHTPAELKQWFKENKWDKVVAFQTRNPLHRAHAAMIERAAVENDAKALLHPVVGMTKEGDIDYVTRVRAYKRLVDGPMKDTAKLSLLPLAMRMAGPREALWHALIRKNYGATHFIVGRDHAGPGKDKKGVPFYGDFDAQDLVKEHEKEAGINLVPFEFMVYVEEKDAYVPLSQVDKKDTVKNISGTELREMLRKGEAIPSWFSFPEVVEELQRGARQNAVGFTVFFTGLSGAGKSTIAELLYSRLIDEYERTVTFLDGDVVRDNLSKGLTHSKEDRDTNVKRIGFVAREVTKHGGIALCSAIAPYEEARKENREQISEVGEYIEVFVATPLEECKKRDTKGLYKKAEQGLIKNFTGISDPYEEPTDAEIDIDTSDRPVEESVQIIIDYLHEHGFLAKRQEAK